MSRGLLVGLALLLAIAGTCSAQTFSDVPQNHWAHDAVEKAARLGLVVGRGDGTFKGDRPPSRYELAMGMSKVLAEIENRMKAQPVFTREVLQLLHNLNKQLAADLDQLKTDVAYTRYLMRHHYTAEHAKNQPDLKREFQASVMNRMKP